MNSNKTPGWLVVLLSILGVAILGPPAFVLLMIALGVAFSVGVALLKVSVVALGIAAVVMLLRAMFGKSTSTPTPRMPARSGESIESIAARMEEEERVRRENLDRELEQALSSRSA
jgi:membrane protein implicated in regulation of membrane protease activity